MDRRTKLYKREAEAIEVKLLQYILDSLCINELTNNGRHFIQKELKKRNYKKS